MSVEKDLTFDDRKAPSVEVGTAMVLSTEDIIPNIDNKKLLWKLDWYLLPPVTLLYLLSFIDRGNIGNAKIEGLTTDLKLVGNQFNIALTVFYFTYSPFELPSNLLMVKFKPHIWLSLMMVSWGVVITLTGIVQSYGGLVTARVFLGITEAGLFPGVAYYLTRWYSRNEIQLRQALFYAAASIAGAFSGLLAYGIHFMDGVGGLAGWRWIFIIEGLLTVVIAAASFFFIQDFPESATFITEDERSFIQHKLQNDGQTLAALVTDENREELTELYHEKSKSQIWDALKDWQCYCHVLVHWSIVTTAYALSVFMPTIINNMGYSSANAQLMSVPPYVAASVFAVITAWYADKYQIRSPLIMVCHVLMITGYIIASVIDVKKHPNSVYGGIFLTTVAVFCGFPAMISWMAVNLEGPYKRGAGMAIHIGIGNLSGAMCVNFFRTQDSPQFKFGYGIEMLFCGVGFVMSAFINYAYYRINKKKKADLAAGKYSDYTPAQLIAMGDKSPYFMYAH